MKIFVSAAFAALLVASPAAAARGRAPDTEATRPPPPGDDPFGAHSGDAVTIKGQTVYPEEHILAADGYVTIIVTTEDEEGGRHVRELGRQAVEFGDNNSYAVNVRVEDAAAAMEQLQADEHVRYAEFDERVMVPPHEDHGDGGGRRLQEQQPYGIGMVLEDVDFWKNLPPPTGSSKVCVVDTGYDISHPDLPPLSASSLDGHSPYQDTLPGELWNVDGHGHGTHCAGTIGAVGNDQGVVGVIPSSLGGKFSFFIGKGLKNNGSGTSSGVMAAVEKCVAKGANVISMSLGGGGYSPALDDTYYNHYKEQDVLIIAAAGNSGNTVLSYPASYKAVMSVAAVDVHKDKAGFSQWNDQVEIAAPGVGVKSTIPNNLYASWSGTSMATPHVAGVAGLLRMHFPECKAFQIRHAMILSAEDQGDAGCDDELGFGIVQAKQAYQYLQNFPCNPDEAFNEPTGGCTEAPPPPCDNHAACDDDDPCTTDTCAAGVCTSEMDAGKNLIEIKVTTDQYVPETAWTMRTEDNIELASGTGPVASTLTTTTVCPAKQADTYNIVFTITDTYGDGICCNYGPGGYVIELDGSEVASGGDFASVEEKEFPVPGTTSTPTNAPTVAPTNAPTPVPTNPLTNSPTNSPTNAPTDLPTNAPTDAATDASTQASTEATTTQTSVVTTQASTGASTTQTSEVTTTQTSEASTDSPTPPVTPPVGDDEPGPAPAAGTIVIDLFQLRFSFAPRPTCVNPANDGPTGGSPRQCAQACAVLATCAGFEVPDEGGCVLATGEPGNCSMSHPTNGRFFERSATLEFEE